MKIDFEIAFNTLQAMLLEKELGKDFGICDLANRLYMEDGEKVVVKVSNLDSQVINDLITLILHLCQHREEISRLTLETSLKTMLVDNKSYYHTAITFLKNNKITEQEKKDAIEAIRSQLNRTIVSRKIGKVVSRTSLKINTAKDVDVLQEVNALMGELNSLDKSYSSIDQNGMHSRHTLDDEKNIQIALDNTGIEDTGTTVFTTHWKSMNKMLQGGFRRKHLVMISSLQHNYKSGMMYNLFMQFIFNNEPAVTEGRKPTILYFSCEDNQEQYMPIIYDFIYYHKYEQPPKIDYKNGLKYDAKLITESIRERPWHTEVMRIDPMKWNIDKVDALIKRYNGEGFEVQAVFFDYLSKLDRIGCRSDGSIGSDLMALYDKAKNIASEHNICFITSHQLSTEGKAKYNAERNDPISFLKSLPGGGYLAGSKQLDQIVDVEIYILKIQISENRYAIGAVLGKQRLKKITPDKHKFILLPFPPLEGPILSDELNLKLGYNIEASELVDSPF